MQVIAQDLEQAQVTADQLKHMLDERDAMIHGELQSKQMNNQMISKQRGEREREREEGEREREYITGNHSSLSFFHHISICDNEIIIIIL